MVPQPVRVSSPLPRAGLHIFGLRPACLVLAGTLMFPLYPIHAQKRRDAILQLRDDVSTAMAHVSLTEKLTQKLDRCRQTLLLAAQSGRVYKAVTKRDLDAAVKDIEKALIGGPFQADDRDLVREDIAELRAIERNQQVRRAGR